MSKYKLLWDYVLKEEKEELILFFDNVKEILGFEIDHSFLKYKKEIESLGYSVKISLKNKTILFKKA